MPIDVDELETKGTEVKTIKNRNAQDAVLNFLEKNKKLAYTQRELGDTLEMRPQQIRQCAIALEVKGLVVRKSCEVPTAKGTESRIFWSLKQ